MTLELDHVFCMVAPDGDWETRLAQAGWQLDAGSAHAGQGTRNRRLPWPEQYLELVWVSDRAEARANPLRLDCRGDWAHSGASPFGFGLRGRLAPAERGDYWLYDALGIPIWVHRDNERAPERPLVFVLEMGDDELERRRSQARAAHVAAHARPGALRSVRVSGPSPPSLPRYAGPPVVYAPGRHRLELVVGDGAAQRVTELLTLTG
jgi:hypothetical protein